MKHLYLILTFIFFYSNLLNAGEIKSLLMTEVDVSQQQVSPGSRTLQDKLPDFGITTIGFEKPECYQGVCTTTAVMIYNDGSLKREVEKDNDKKIVSSGSVNRSSVFLLQEYIVNSGYFDLDIFYGVPATDLQPPRIFMVTRDGKNKFLMNYAYAAPNKIWVLEVLIEYIVSTAEWED